MALRKALVESGVSEEDLDILVRSQLPNLGKKLPSVASLPLDPVKQPVSSPIKTKWSADAQPFVPTRVNTATQTIRLPPTPPSPLSEEYHSHEGQDDWEDEAAESYYGDDHQDRSIVLRGFSPFTTLADVAKIVRGGIVLHMYLRPAQHTAHVSFVDPLAAEKFIMHYKRNDIYFKGKRIDVAWEEKQRYMPGYIQRNVMNGATRNLVIRFPKNDMTEETVREDLEHIHQLEVVDIITANNHIFVSTNGIQHALTAKHCLRSRLKYRNSRIEFFEDECDQVLPTVVRKVNEHGFQPQPIKRPATVSMANRFAPLFEQDGDLEDKDKPMMRVVPAGPLKEPAWVAAVDWSAR